MESHKNAVTTFLLIAIGMLVLAIPPVWPYGYYILLRIVVCGVAVYAIYVGYNVGLRTLLVILGFIALLFNPIIPIYLTKEIWVLIDIIVAIIFLVSIFILRRRINNHRSRKRAKKLASSAKQFAESWAHAQPFWSWNSNLKILNVSGLSEYGYMDVWLGVELDGRYSYYKMVLDGELNIMSVMQYQRSPYTEDVQNDLTIIPLNRHY